MFSSTPEKLVEQMTCGAGGIEKTVVIPKVLFPLMLGRLSSTGVWMSGARN